jgi:hypothetical protein
LSKEAANDPKQPLAKNIKDMSTNNSIQWKRISAEGATIVISIILAFSIDAWWDERQERRDEIEILERLQMELSVNIERIDRVTVNRTRKLEYAIELFALIEEAQAQGDETIDVPTMMLMHLADSSTFEADIPVLQGIIRSARLEIIENKDILTAIARWESGLRNYTEVALRERQNTDNRFIPSLYGRGDTAHVLMRLDGPGALTADSDPNDVTTIRIDDRFKALVAERTENARRSSSILREARMAAANAREVIETAK